MKTCHFLLRSVFRVAVAETLDSEVSLKPLATGLLLASC